MMLEIEALLKKYGIHLEAAKNKCKIPILDISKFNMAFSSISIFYE